MKAKKNRYYLGHRELGKPQLYGNGKEASKHLPALVIVLSGVLLGWPRQLHFNQDGIKRGGVAQVGKFF